MMPFSFILPASFDPAEFLKSPALITRRDDARYFVSLILTKLARRDVDELGVVRLRGEFLKNIMHQTDYAAVVKSLLDGGAVERFRYTVGERSFGFRLASRFVTDNHVRVPATDSRLIRRLQRFHEQAVVELDSRMKPVHRALALHQQRLQIDGDDARRTLASLPPDCNLFDTQGILIRDIERHEFRISVGQYGRVANNITCLKRELRQALHVDGEPLVCVDLSCAQPALLGKLIADNGSKAKAEGRQGEGREQSGSNYDSSFRPASDLDSYLPLVQTGRFYEYMQEQLLAYDISRDEIKRRFLVDVLAKKGNYSSTVENAFQQLFPSVHRFIQWTNRDGQEHANLIRLLQQAESSFVIETVCSELVTRHPRMFCISLHDAIYSTVGDVPRVEQAFHRAFQKTRFPMMVKVTA